MFYPPIISMFYPVLSNPCELSSTKEFAQSSRSPTMIFFNGSQSSFLSNMSSLSSHSHPFFPILPALTPLPSPSPPRETGGRRPPARPLLDLIDDVAPNYPRAPLNVGSFQNCCNVGSFQNYYNVGSFQKLL